MGLVNNMTREQMWYVAVVRKLPVLAILGRNVPDMLHLLKGMER